MASPTDTPTDIPAPLSDRSLAHGRNVMAVAGVIVVLAWVPHIEITKFEPLGFKITEGGELYIWLILAVVLGYYAIRFCADCWTDYSGWRDTYKGLLKLALDNDVRKKAHSRHVYRLNRKFWGWDAALPALMFLVALFAAVQQIAPLAWPPLP